MHRIWMPDDRHGWTPRMIDWDPNAGTLDGDHSCIDGLREWIDRVVADGNRIYDVAGYWQLSDPWREPADFLLMLRLHLGGVCWYRDGLPEALRHVEVTQMTAWPLGPGAVA